MQIGGRKMAGWYLLYTPTDNLAMLDVINNADGRFEVFGINREGNIYHTWQTSPSNGWVGDDVPPPTVGLGSNSNYFLYNCDSILGLSVTINVTQDIAGSEGCGFQVNAYSASGDLDGGQQYVLTMDPQGQLLAGVDNWQNAGQLINHFTPMATLPTAKLPAGHQLTIALQNDASGNITGAAYTVIDHNGNTVGNTVINLLSLDVFGTSNSVTVADLAPIVAFQLDIVGWANNVSTTLSSGTGEVTYTASSSLTVGNTEPSCVDWDYVTTETANSIYSPMPPGPGQTFTQSFGTGPATAMIRKTATVEHALRPTSQ
jgi:hypothetical protein